MNYKILSITDGEEWNKYLSQLTDHAYDVYFTPDYYKLFEEYGDGKALCFVYEENGHLALYPFMLNSVNQIGFNLDKDYYDIQGAYGYNGVVSSTSEPVFAEKFYKLFDEYCNKNNIIAEFTRFHPLLGNHIFSFKHHHIIYDRKTVYVQLNNQSYEDIFNKFQRTTRKQIKKAREFYGIKVNAFRGNFADASLLYDLYYETMKYVNSESYLFFNLQYFRSLLANPNHIVFLCYYETQVIAMAIILAGRKYLHGHLIGVRNEFRYMSLFSLIYDSIIRYGCENEFEVFHIGGGATVSPDDTLLKYKQHFSCTTSDFFIGKKIYNNEIFEDVVRQWTEKYPWKIEKYSNILLKYRY